MHIRKMGAEHSIDVDLLPEAPVVLDVGCRDFEFDLEILKIRPEARIIAFDPDPNMPGPTDTRIVFVRGAVTEVPDETVRWQGPGDGAYIINSPSGFGWGEHDPAQSATVHNTTIPKIMEDFSVKHFDLVKLDCESSEFGILENWPGPIATQISVELHSFIDPNRWNEKYFYKLFSGPLKDYNVPLFGLTPLGPGNSLSYWDTLLTLK